MPNDPLKRRIAGLGHGRPANNRVLLIQSPLFLIDTFNADIARAGGAYAYPPVGLQFIKSALAGRGLDIDILDLNYEILMRVQDDPDFTIDRWPEILDRALDESAAAVYGVTLTCVPGHPADKDFFFTDIMRRIVARDCGVVIAGGSIATKHNAWLLQQGHCHFVVTGEGEHKARWLFDRLYGHDGGTPAQAGIFFLDGDTVVESEGAIDGELASTVLDTYPDIPIEQYWRLGCLNPFSKMAGYRVGERGGRFCTIQLNRGCRANCKFCGVYEFMGKGVRQRDTDNVIGEIRYLVERRGVRHIDILDDDFLGVSGSRAGLNRVLGEIAELRRQYPDITWAAGNGLVAASIDEELLDLMHRAGCIGFRIGIESGNDEMLKKLRRPSSKKDVLRVSEMLKKVPDIFVSGNYIIGFFGVESFAEILDTFRFSNRLELDWAGFSVFQFTSKLDPENRTADDTSTNEFVPTKDHWRRLIEGRGDVVTGPAVFSMDPTGVPTPAQVKEIWFAFNLLANYVNNKNLRPGGRPDKFALWTDALFLSYPENAYMPLFSGLAHLLVGDREAARERFSLTRENLRRSDYWSWRFDEFGLTELAATPPDSAAAAERALSETRAAMPVEGN